MSSPTSTDHAELDAVASTSAEFSADSEERQRARAAEAILNTLPEAQRAVFVLFELEEMSGQDIASLLDVSLGTVKSRLRLARDTFRRAVGVTSCRFSGVVAFFTSDHVDDAVRREPACDFTRLG